MQVMGEKPELLALTVDIVAAFVGRNDMQAVDLRGLITDVYCALSDSAAGIVRESKESQDRRPAVPVKRSVHDEFIVCLEDGKKFKSLKRHLRTHYNLTPEQYREKWGLPPDYPMVAPNYAAARSKLAKKIGLGRRKRS
jgi:MucR family transcriptional regulator, transcriptional regulator of exopolysaccharide biosynthesis